MTEEERPAQGWLAGLLARWSRRRRCWEEVAPATLAGIQKDAASLAEDYRVAVEEFSVAHYPLLERLFLAPQFFRAPPPRITAFTVRFGLLALTLTSMERTLTKFPALRAQLPEVFAPLFGEPAEAVRARLNEVAQKTPGVSRQELWEMTGNVYLLMKHVVIGDAARVTGDELNLMEREFRQTHETGVRCIARRLAGTSPDRD